MAYEQKPGDISVFKERSKKNPKGPDWTGTVVLPDGSTMRVALWERGDHGTMLAGSISEPMKSAPSSERPSAVKERVYHETDDEIPF